MTAPVPAPFIIKVGGELYSDPVLSTNTSIILPSVETIGFNCADFPDFKAKDGCL